VRLCESFSDLFISADIDEPNASSGNPFSCLDFHDLEASMNALPLLSRIAERHLYADIALHGYEKCDSECNCHCQLPLRVEQFSSLLSERPHIANYVLNLTIHVISQVDDELVPFLEAVPFILAPF